LERLCETDVVRQAKSPYRYGRAGLQSFERGRELGADMTVLDDDDLVRATELLMDGAAECRLEVVRPIGAVDGQQQGERCVHVDDATDAERTDGERTASRT
jgi:hypothetical protein